MAYGWNYGAFGAVQAPAPMSDERIWVANQTQADNYLVAANGFVRLWDSTQPRYYEKKADATGRPYPMEIYEYKRVEGGNLALNNDARTNGIEEQLNALEGRIKAIEEHYAAEEVKG